MKKTLLLKTMLLLCALVAGSLNGWAADASITSTFTAGFGVGTGEMGWTSSKAGGAMDSGGRGCGFYQAGTYTLTAQNQTDFISGNIKSVELVVSANKVNNTISVKCGDVDFKVGDNTNVSVANSNNQTFTFTGNATKNSTIIVTINNPTTAKSLWTKSIKVTYENDERTAIASDIVMSPTEFDFNKNGNFGLSITAATGKTESDYTVSCKSDDEDAILASGVGYTTYTKKGYANVTVTVSPTAANEASYKPFSKKIMVKVYDFTANDGSESKPFTVAEAKTFKETPDVFYDADKSYYVKGWIDRLGTYNSSTKKYSYYISDDATTTGELWVYTGKNLNNTDFTAATDLEIEDYVVVYGKLGTRSSTTILAEGNYITTLNRRSGAGFYFADEQLNTYPNTTPFTGSYLNNPNNVTVAYSTNNADVADVNAETGAITIGSTEGTATITATYTGTTVTPYKTTKATYKIKVARDANGLVFPTDPDITTHANNADVTEPELTNPNSLDVSWSSTDELVATVDANGQVTTHEKEGTATIKATYVQTDHYKGGEVSYKVTVERGDLDHEFTPSSVTLKKGEAFTSPTFAGTEEVSGWTFSSTYNNVATVSNAGIISLGGSTGTAIIKANFAQNDYYHAYETICTITVNPAEDILEPKVPGSYSRISSIADLEDGAKYLVVCEGSNVAMGGQNGSYRNAVDVEIISNTISDAENATEVTLEKNDDKWKLKFDNGKYYTTTAKKSMSEGDTGTEATIEFSSNNVLITFGDYGLLSYNSEHPRFLNYATTQNDIQLYKYEAGTPVNNFDIFVSEAGMATYTSNFALDYSSNANLKAYIAVEDNGAIKYNEVKKVPANTGVLLRATDGGGKSYTVNVTTETTDDVTGNKFIRGNDAAVASNTSGGLYNYILNVVNNQIGFYRANNQTVAKNRAYLQTTINAGNSSNARIMISFDDESGTTGIDNVRGNMEEGRSDFFDLQGRKVANPGKGLYIVNRRKVVVK